jgi:hypothetical protein
MKTSERVQKVDAVAKRRFLSGSHRKRFSNTIGLGKICIMRNRFARLALLMILAGLVCMGASRAAVDDMEHNADLQPTIEELARETILKRWPEAADIQVFEAEDEEDVEEFGIDAEAFEKGGQEPPAPDANDPAAPGDAAPLAVGMEAGDWTVSATFMLGELECEALLNDDGKLLYRYEAVDPGQLPEKTTAAAREKFPGEDLLYADKLFDERPETPVMYYVIAFEKQDVYLDADGKILRVVDAPPQAEGGAAEPDDDGNMDNIL